MIKSHVTEPDKYMLRIMSPRDVTQDWCRWLADHTLMRQINAAPAQVSKAQLGTYVAAMTAQNIGVIGVFRKRDGAHVGVYEVKTDMVNQVANISVLIDFRSYDIAAVFGATEAILVSELARRRAIQKAAMVVPSSFTRFLSVPEPLGWQPEGVLRAEFTNFAKSDQRLDGHCFGKLART